MLVSKLYDTLVLKLIFLNWMNLIQGINLQPLNIFHFFLKFLLGIKFTQQSYSQYHYLPSINKFNQLNQAYIF
jgi:hypothetical protein